MGERPIAPARTAAIAGLVVPIAVIALSSCTSIESTIPAIGTSTQNQAGQQQASASDLECPGATIRTGAAAWQIPPGSNPTNVRYQGSLGQIARECTVLGETMTVRIGVEGRLLVGPKGGPGKVDVPLRIALVEEGPQPRPIWSKFYSVPVEVPDGASQAIFTQVEDDLTFPLPANRRLDNYIVYVGFDPQGAIAESKGKGKSTTAKRSAPPTPERKPAPTQAKKTTPAPAAPAAKQPQFDPPPSAAGRQQPQFDPPPSGSTRQQQPQFEPPPNVFAPPPGTRG